MVKNKMKKSGEKEETISVVLDIHQAKKILELCERGNDVIFQIGYSDEKKQAFFTAGRCLSDSWAYSISTQIDGRPAFIRKRKDGNEETHFLFEEQGPKAPDSLSGAAARDALNSAYGEAAQAGKLKRGC